MKGTAFKAMGEYKKSIVWYELANMRDPKYIFAYNSKGSILYAMGEYKNSII